jgi:Holliday junction resolvase
MNTFKSSAIQILKKADKPLHVSEITKLALESGLLVTESAVPEATMGAQMYMDIKNKGKASDFVQTSKGTFTLNDQKVVIKPTEKAISKIVEKEKVEDEKIIVEGGYTGKGGEHLVTSELLFRGYNASIMSVDVGIDISAIKDNKFFGIQVKTSNANKFDVYNFHIRKVSFDRHNQGNIFYIFVLRGTENKFLILSSSDVERKIKEGAIYAVNNNTGYALLIKIRDNQIFLGSKHDMNYYLNNWDLIK